MALQTPLRPMQTPGDIPPPAPPAPPVAPAPPAVPATAPGPSKPPKWPQFDTRLPLTDEERRELGRKLSTKIEQAISRRRDHDDRVRMWREQYEAVSYPKLFPWPNAAALNVPITRTIVDTIHARLLRAVGGTSPLFRCEAMASEDGELAMKIEQLLEWQFADQINIKNVWDPAYLSALRDGNSVILVDWDKTIERTRRPEMVPHPKTGEPTPALVEKDDYEYNQPRLRVIDILDFYLYPANARSVDEAIGVFHRVWKTANGLRRGVKDGLYDKDDVADILARAPEADTRTEMAGGDAGMDGNEGIESADASDPEDRSYELFECIWQYDADGDGIDEDCCFVLERHTGTLLRAEHYPFWHGRRCFVPVTPYPRPNRFYGYSLPEILEDLSAEINAIRNQRVDAGTLTLAPILVKRRGIRTDTNKTTWAPGRVLEADDPKTDFSILSFPNVTQSAFAEQQSAREEAERVTGVSDASNGVSPSRSRPLGETQALLTEGNLKFEVLIGRLHRANTEIAQQILALDRQFLTAETEFMVTRSAERLFATITQDELRARVRLQPTGNTLTTDAQLRLQAAETLYQMMQTNPLMSGNLTHVYAVVVHYLQAMGIQNPIPFIGTEEEAAAKQAQMEQQPPKPEPPALSGRLDEPGTLAVAIAEGVLTPQQYQAAQQLAQQTMLAKASAQAVGQVMTQEHQADAARRGAAHDAAQDRMTAAHDAAQDRMTAAHAAGVGIAQAAAQKAMAMPPPNQGNAAPNPGAPGPMTPGTPTPGAGGADGV